MAGGGIWFRNDGEFSVQIWLRNIYINYIETLRKLKFIVQIDSVQWKNRCQNHFVNIKENTKLHHHAEMMINLLSKLTMSIDKIEYVPK